MRLPLNNSLSAGVRLAAPVAVLAIFCTFACAPLLTNKGLDNLVRLLGPLPGTLSLAPIAAIALAGLLSIPVTGFIGLAGLSLSYKHGFKMGVNGLIAVLASAYHLFWWVKYGGLPI